jgi:hypothetical protein
MPHAIQPLGYAPQSSLAVQLPASRASVARFESLLYAPTTKTSASLQPEALKFQDGAARLRAYADEMSALWRANAIKAEQMMNGPSVSYRDLLVFQREIGSTLVSVELASKTSGMVESGVQTLVQRS